MTEFTWQSRNIPFCIICDKKVQDEYIEVTDGTIRRYVCIICSEKITDVYENNYKVKGEKG